MTRPVFNHPFTIDSVHVDHHLSELRQVATDLRNARALSEPTAARRANRVRLAIGSALPRAGFAFVARPSRPSAQAR